MPQGVKLRLSELRLSRLLRLDVLTAVVLAAFIMLPRPGRVAFDTKLDLAVDPLGFMSRALQVWNPQGGLGEMQNQAVGYLFPMGPFFALGDLLGLPPWVVQRGWQALLVVGAYIGFRRLAERLGLGTGWPAWLGALAYALAPRVLTTLGPISAEALSATMLPWILLPLVRPELAGSPRRAAARSAAAVLLLGGANGGVTVAVLMVPVLWLATRRPGPARRHLATWWTVLTAAACLWWFVPLTVMGRFSPPFMDFIETAENTAAGITPFSAVRGATHWVAYFSRNGEPWWSAGWDLATNPVLVVSTALVAAVGVAGLSRRDMPERLPLVLSAAAGLLLLALGADAAGSTPLAEWWRALLDGSLAPFRNIHKFDPVLRLPLALGLAHALRVLLAGVWSQWVQVRSLPTGPVLRSAAAFVAVVAVLVSAWPMAAGKLRNEPSWEEIPGGWTEAAAYLESQKWDTEGVDTARALLVPSSGFGEYLWGRTVDEPLQPLARSAWAVRNQVPLSAVGSVRLLDSVEQTLAAGRPSSHLAELLNRSGISYLVVRNDLDWLRTGSPRPSVVHAVVDHSPGLQLVASFGDMVEPPEGDGTTVVSHGVDGSYPSVQIYRVEGLAPTVRAVPFGDVRSMSGGPESLLPAMEAGAVEADRPVVLTGDDPPPGLGGWVLTDGLRRRDRNVGRVQGNLSHTLTADERRRVDRAAPDLLPFDADGHQTVVQLSGVAAVRASTSEAFADSMRATRAEYQPFAAIDGDPATSWRSSNVGSPVGQYLEVELDRAVDLSGAALTMERDLLLGPLVTAVRIETHAGVRTTQLDGANRTVVDVAPGPTRTIRVVVESTEAGAGSVGIRELELPGVDARRTLLLPSDAPQGPDGAPSVATAVVMSDDMPASRSCVGGESARPQQVGCDPALHQGSEDGAVVDRTFDLERAGQYRVSATVVPKGQTRLARYLDPVASGVTVSTSSALGDDLAVRGGAAVDGDPLTSWVASVDDPDPTATLTWGEPRTISSLTVVPSTEPVAARPQRLELTAGDRTWTANLTESSIVRFEPVTTTSLTVRLVSWERSLSLDPSTTVVSRVPPGVAELSVPELADLVYAPDLSARIGELCGTGPTIVVDGREVATQVSGNLGDLVGGRRLTAEPCVAADVEMGPGRHHVTTRPSGDWRVVGVALKQQLLEEVPAVRDRGVQVLSWSPTQRTVDVGAGDEAVLFVQESANTGWVATHDGRTLTPTVVDGWQQAWVLPEGAGGEVKLEYVPQRTHVLGLVGGGLVALLVVVAALTRPRPGRAVALEAGPGRLATVLTLLAVAVPVLLAGGLGLACLAAGLALSLPAQARWSGWFVPALSVGGLATAALLVALGRGGAMDVDSRDAVVQVLTLVPVSLLVGSLVGHRLGRPPKR